MPKRVLDGEGLWRSDKLARVKPEWIRAEYANLLPLSLANGVFEVEPRRVWSLVYSYNRPEIKIDDVKQILGEFDSAGMLFRWKDTGTGKAWGFWVGIDKRGRLPSPSRLNKKHEAIGPTPPEKKLNEYIKSRADNQWLANGEHGFCSGSGIGSGIGSGGKEGAPENGAPVAQATPRPSPFAFSGTHLTVSEKQDCLLSEAFPWADRQAEYKKVDAWLEANPQRRPRKFPPFLHNWFSRIQSPSEVKNGFNQRNGKPSGAINAPSGKYDNRKPEILVEN